MFHFLGLAMGMSVPFANMTMAGLINKAAPPEKPILGRFPLVMSKVGKVGLLLLWITGLTMFFTRWKDMSLLAPWFHIKLAAVVLLTIVVLYIHSLEGRIRKGDAAALARVQVLGKVALSLALLAVIFAVVTFA